MDFIEKLWIIWYSQEASNTRWTLTIQLTTLKISIPKKTLISYQGCHLGNFKAENLIWNNVGPYGRANFEYKSIPAVHFEKQSCTAWHSDRLSEENTVHVRTTLMHNLGMHGRHALNKKLPHAVTPVFAKMAIDKIGHHNLIWPSSWGTYSQPYFCLKKSGDTLIHLAFDK